MRTLTIILLLSIFAGCKKDKTVIPVQAGTEYVNLNNIQFKLNSPFALDLNKDGKNDLLFHTEFQEGFPKDFTEFRVVPQIECAILGSGALPKVFNKGEIIESDNTPGFGWIDDPVILVKRVYEIELDKSHWEGAWKDAENKYLGLQLTKNGTQFIAWLRISIAADKSHLILHDASISKVPGHSLVAGQLK